MALSNDGKDTIARALTSAFPSVGDRLRVLTAAGLGDIQATGDAKSAWRHAVDDAAERGAVARLLSTAGRESLYIRMLALDVAEGRTPGLGFRRVVQMGLAGVAAALVILLAILVVTRPPASRPAAADARTPASPVMVAPVPVTPVATAPEPVPTPEPVAPTPEPVAPSPEPVTSASAVPGACGAPDASGRIGWVYVGERAPKVVDGVLSLPTSGNVRIDYPNAENRWNSRARIRCWLPKGARVRLAGEVASIPPHDYWAPIGGVLDP